ncbi:MAG: hypothetical protein HFG80_04140 [Eubacterium sp.]|nr:hypothetical protein [Eubacterium sp.]
MNDTISYEINRIILQDLIIERPFQEIMAHICNNFQLNIFILDQHSRLLFHSSAKEPEEYFSCVSTNGNDTFCFENQANSGFLTTFPDFSKYPDGKLFSPDTPEGYYTYICAFAEKNHIPHFLCLKFKNPHSKHLAMHAVRPLIRLCQAHLSDSDLKLPPVRSSISTLIARELLLYDDSIIMHQKNHARRLPNTHHGLKPPFAIGAFHLRKPRPQNNDFTFAIYEIEYQFPNSYVLVYDSTLFLFFYNYQSRMDAELENFAFQQQLFASISDPFQNLNERLFFRQQASAILQIGKTEAPQKYLYHFLDFYDQLKIQHSAKRFGNTTVMLSDIELLAEYDQCNNTEYLRTLEAYLNCFHQASHAAKQLFINKGTLKYRLEKISQLLHLDIENPNISSALYSTIRFYRQTI